MMMHPTVLEKSQESRLFVDVCFQRRAIVASEVEPTDDECNWPSDEEEEEGSSLSVRFF